MVCRWCVRSGGQASASPDEWRLRVAVYYAPQPEDALFAEGAAWLGRNPEKGAPVPQPDIPNIAEATAEPRLYGFHATLKPPMRLAEGCRPTDVVEAATEALPGGPRRSLCRALAVSDVFGFLALRETHPLPAFAGAGRCLRRAA